MITKLSIENFKGIRERVELELRPITLLFGANSAGKSSILHALHYAAEIFERRNLDADQTVTGGEFVDLGGFSGLVHGHDLDRTVWLRFDMSDGVLAGEPHFAGSLWGNGGSSETGRLLPWVLIHSWRIPFKGIILPPTGIRQSWAIAKANMTSDLDSE